MTQRITFHRVAVAVALAAMLSIGIATIAFAHSRPIRFDPAPGQVVTSAPSQVNIWFNNALRRDPNWTFIRVANSQGQRVDTGDAALSADRKQLTVSLQPNLPPGRYTVTWRNWDEADGHILGACYNFYIGEDAVVSEGARFDVGNNCESADISAREGTPAPGAPLVATEEESAPETQDEDSDGSEVPLWVTILAVGAGAGGGFVLSRLLVSRGS